MKSAHAKSLLKKNRGALILTVLLGAQNSFAEPSIADLSNADLANADPSIANASIAGPSIAKQRPNIILILADDLGFSDLGSYGSEISTPNLDQLANSGVRFSNYHTAASCAPTRAMLLTGADNHIAGVANIPEAIPQEQQDKPGYAGTLSKSLSTVASRLQQSGYHTYMAGKWHLGRTPDLLPSRRGFERAVTMADTGADNWEKKSYLPIYSEAHWYEDGKPIDLPENFYSSRFYVDKMIDYIDSNLDDKKPFFSYLAFQAVHIPVQAPKKYTENYIDTYQQGWHELRKNRYQGAVEQGLIADNIDLALMPTTKQWDSLTPENKKYQQKKMAVYAGMIEAMDFHIGRLIQHLKSTGQYENTIILFTSDNGPEASDPLTMGNAVTKTLFNAWMASNNYNADYESLGEKGSYNVIGPSFASAAASPFAWYKFFSGEGGLRVPLIISASSLAEIPRQGLVTHAFSWVTDITPTILQLAKVNLQASPEMIGHSLLPLVNGETERVYQEDEVVAYEIGGNAALYKGQYKVTINRGPVGDGKWHLFDLQNDPGETNDLHAQMPQKFAELMKDYEDYKLRNGVLEVAPGYDQRREVASYGIRKRLGHGGLLGLGLLTAGFLFAIFLGLVRLYRRINHKQDISGNRA